MFQAFEKTRKASKPSDGSVVIDLELELDWLWLKSAREIFNKAVCALDKFDVMKMDRELYMLLVRKNHNAALILSKKIKLPYFNWMHNTK